MQHSPTRGLSASPWKRRARYGRTQDLFFIAVALATVGGVGYALLRLLGGA